MTRQRQQHGLLSQHNLLGTGAPETPKVCVCLEELPGPRLAGCLGLGFQGCPHPRKGPVTLCPRLALSQDVTGSPPLSVLQSFKNLLSSWSPSSLPVLPPLLCLLELFLVCLIPGGCSGLGDSAPPRCTHSTLGIDSKSD